MMMHNAFDTTHDALREHIKGLRRLGIGGQAAMASELSDNLRRIVNDGVRWRHPSWNEAQVKRDALRIVLGDRLFNELSEKVKRRVQ